MVSESEKAVLRTFRKFLMSQGEMLCFFGPDLEKHKNALQQLIARDWLVNEQFKGGYSLTPAGFKAMKACTD